MIFPHQNQKILIVEDEKNLGETLQLYLSSKWPSCYLASTGEEARLLFQQHSPQVILMDIGLPDTSGLILAKEFFQQRKDFVLLFLSAQHDPLTRVEGLEMGADDYVAKPFELKELSLRLGRILRGQQNLQIAPDCVHIGALKIYFKKYELVDADEQVISLSQKECGILQFLFSKKNQVVDRNEIIDHIWGEDSFPSERTVDNYIVKLRRWCESDSSGILKIMSVRGIGYKLIVDDSSIHHSPLA
jgi:two-component system alkaline phosphatase synthesis response regulator PhoP